MSLTLDTLGHISTGLDVAWPAESSWLSLRRLLVLNHVTLHQLRSYLKQCATCYETDSQGSSWTAGGLADLLQAQDPRAGLRRPTDRNPGIPEEPSAEARHWVPPVLARWHCVSKPLRICSQCMREFGYHSPFHQLLYFTTCPIHGTEFTEQAPCCGRWLGHNARFSTYLCQPCGWTGPSAMTLQTRPEPPHALIRFIDEYRRFLAECDRKCVTVARDRDGVSDLHPRLDYAFSSYAMDDLQQQAARLFRSFGLRMPGRSAAKLKRVHKTHFTMRVSPELPIIKLPQIKKLGRRRDSFPPDDTPELDDYYEAIRQGIRLPYNAFQRMPNRIIAKSAHKQRSHAHTVSGRTGPPWARYVTRDVDRLIRHALMQRMPRCRHLPSVLSTKVPAGIRPNDPGMAWCPPCLAFWHWRYAVSNRNAGTNSIFGSAEINLCVSDRILVRFRSPTLVGVGRLADHRRYQIPVRLRASLLRADLLRLFDSLLILYWHDWIIQQELYPAKRSVHVPPSRLLPTTNDALYWATEHYRSYVTLVDDDLSAQMLFYNWPSLHRFEAFICCHECSCE